MAMDIVLDNPVILQMAMHVVGEEGSEEADYLPETGVEHHDFFLDRIKETIKGCKCQFLEASGVLPSLSAIKLDSEQFYRKSKALATSFHGAILAQGGAVPGAFLLFEIQNAGEKIYSIIKYEHDDVVHYQRKRNDGDEQDVLVMELLKTTFVKKPQAMQKSALIAFDGDESVIHVVDRSEPKGVTRYFKNYLGAVRLFADDELTEKMDSAINAFVAQAIKVGVLDKSIRKVYRTNFYNFVNADGASFDPDNAGVFVAAIVGQSSDDLITIFERELKKKRIEGEKFEFDKTKVDRPKKLRTKTNDGIEITFDEAHVQQRKYIKEANRIIIDISTGLEEDADQLG